MSNNHFPIYHPGNSILHAAKTRNKFLLAIAFIFASGIESGFILFGFIFLCHLGILISGISFLDAWRRLAALKTFLLVLGGVPLFLTPGVPIELFDGFNLPITKEGLEGAIFTICRLALIVWVSMVLIWTTPPESLMKAVTGLGSSFYPKSKILQEFVLVGMLAFQTFPSLLAEAEEEMGKSWRKQNKLCKERRIFGTVKEMVQSLVIWAITVIAEPDRLSKWEKKP